jgi:hypothetical protein
LCKYSSFYGVQVVVYGVALAAIKAGGRPLTLHFSTVRAHPGRLSTLRVFHSKAVFYGGFV